MKDEKASKFNVGDKVYLKLKPKTELIVRKYYAGIYYCTIVDEPGKKELALFERELLH